MKHEICRIRDIPSHGTMTVPFFGREIHVYRNNQEIRAVANVCLHLGGPLECKNDQLVCPWHNASFDMQTGERTTGPGPEDARLMFLPTKVECDKLYYVWDDRS